MKMLWAALIAVGVGGCSNEVKVKQDTPQALAATVIKLYEAKDNSKWQQVIDPALAKIVARNESCWADKIRGTASACFCGPQGTSNGPKSYVETRFHEALTTLRLRSKTCRVTDAEDHLTTAYVKHALLASVSEPMCNDVTDADVFGTVKFTCDNDRYELVLRKAENAWRVFYFEGDTSSRLVSLSLAAGTTKGAEQREKDLNKDLK